MGGYGGIGAALCRILAQSCGHLMVAGRDPEKIEVLASELSAVPYCLNATRPDQVEACFKEARARFDAIHGAANCVGFLLLKSVHLTEVMAKASAVMHALGRIGEPSQVASAIAWLLNPEQSFLTGQVIGVDGGLAKVRARATA